MMKAINNDSLLCCKRSNEIKKNYSTSEVAEIIGIHPNTVRLYEKLGLITKSERLPNGYRLFTEEHLLQFRLGRIAFEVEVLQSGLRKEAVNIVKTIAMREYSKAIKLTKDYLTHVRKEQENAEEAISIARGLLSGADQVIDDKTHTRKEAADLLNVTVDTLRNWELNGLFKATRMRNGYRVYDAHDMQTLKLIRTLRLANYSLAAILRMMKNLTHYPQSDIRNVIDTPETDEDIVSVYDRLQTSLRFAEKNAKKMLVLLREIGDL